VSQQRSRWISRTGKAQVERFAAWLTAGEACHVQAIPPNPVFISFLPSLEMDVLLLLLNQEYVGNIEIADIAKGS
jgi:hypothetical protein